MVNITKFIQRAEEAIEQYRTLSSLSKRHLEKGLYGIAQSYSRVASNKKDLARDMLTKITKSQEHVLIRVKFLCNGEEYETVLVDIIKQEEIKIYLQISMMFSLATASPYINIQILEIQDIDTSIRKTSTI